MTESINQDIALAERFEEHRPRLRAVAYRMLGSLSEAEDAVQETWLRLGRTGDAEIDNLAAWLTTVVARVCLNVLRGRRTRREEPLEFHLPDPVVEPEGHTDPEHEALLADAVGMALVVVLDTLPPAERLAFVLHDMFAVPFDDIAAMLDRTPEATRQLASRARRKIRDSAPRPDPDLQRQREAVDAFFAAAHDGDFDRLLSVLDADAVLRVDGGTSRPGRVRILHGATTIASQARGAAKLTRYLRPVLVNGTAGAIVIARGRPLAVIGFTVVDGRIAAIDILNDLDRLAALDLGGLDTTDPSRT